MKIDFNNLRKNACKNYILLCNKLNEHINSEGRISIRTEEIQDIMDNIRINIAIIACTYQKNKKFANVSGDTKLPKFNPEGNSNE